MRNKPVYVEMIRNFAVDVTILSHKNTGEEE